MHINGNTREHHPFSKPKPRAQSICHFSRWSRCCWTEWWNIADYFLPRSCLMTKFIGGLKVQQIQTVSCQLPCFGFTSCQATSRHLTCFKTDLMDNWPLLISYLMLSDLLPSLPFWPLTFWQLACIHKWPFWQITFSQFTCLDVFPIDSLPVRRALSQNPFAHFPFGTISLC